MRRNVDVLKDMEKEIKAFQYTDDEICVLLDEEGCDLFTLYDEDDSSLQKIKIHILKIEELLGQLTEDFLDMIDYETFDCESFKWCVGKIQYNDLEIVNYIETFTNMIATLDSIVHEYLKGYKLLTQAAYDGGGKSEEGV